VTSTLDAFQIPWKRNEKTGEVDHPAIVYIISPEGKIKYTFNNPSVDWIVDAAKRK
jgi:cytochrome oxidase Cu insertion factor (SCO1/SenC/PrrC family)